jgi:SPP1 family predicted phage head-tail adaptor
MPLVPIGRMDRRVILKRRTVTRDAMGGILEAWTTIATVWGRRMDTTGREYIAAGHENAERSTRFTIRWRSDVNPSWRLECEGLDYDIVSMTEIGRRQWLEMVATVADAGTEIDPEDEGGSP